MVWIENFSSFLKKFQTKKQSQHFFMQSTQKKEITFKRYNEGPRLKKGKLK